MIASRLLRIELTVSDLPRASRFYQSALGFEFVSQGELAPSMAALLGARQVHEVILRRRGQELALHEFEPRGAPYPDDAAACDQAFQHFAMPADDIGPAVARLDAVAISHGGAQRLPQRSGGATAFKFRDPDCHPLELIQFPTPRATGIDHSAIVVADAARSIAFYRETLGLHVAAQQRNTGPEQDRLDGLDDVSVEVIALQPQTASPHLELLAYQSPPVRRRPIAAPADIAATRLVFEIAGKRGGAVLTHDPDGHALVLVGAP